MFLNMNQEVPYLPKNSKWSSSKNYLPVLTFCNEQYLTLKQKRSISNVWNQASSNVKNYIQTKCKENKKEGKKPNPSNNIPTVPLYYYYPTYHRPKSYLSQLEIMSQMYKKKIKNVNTLKNTIANEVSIRNETVKKHIQTLKNLKNEQNNDQELFQKGLNILYDNYQKEKQIANKLKNIRKNKKSDLTFKNSQPKNTKKRTIFTMTDAVCSSMSDRSVKTDKIKTSIYSSKSHKKSSNISTKSSKSLSNISQTEENSLNSIPCTSCVSHTENQTFKSHYERSYLKNNELYSKPLLLTSEKATKCTNSISKISKCSKNTKMPESPVEKNIYKKLISNEDKLKTTKYKDKKIYKLPSVSNSISLNEAKICKKSYIESSLPRIDLKKCQKWEDSQSRKIIFSNQIREVENILESASKKNIFQEKLKKFEIKPDIKKDVNYRLNFIKNITAKTKVGRYNKYNSDTNDSDIHVEKQVKSSKSILPLLRLPSLPDTKMNNTVFPGISKCERSLKNLKNLNAMREQIEKELSRRVDIVCRTGFYPLSQKKFTSNNGEFGQIIATPVLDFDCNSSKSNEICVPDDQGLLVEVQEQLIDDENKIEQEMTNNVNSFLIEEIEDETNSRHESLYVKKSNFDYILKTEDDQHSENDDISRSEKSCKHETSVSQIIAEADSINEDFQEINDAISANTEAKNNNLGESFISVNSLGETQLSPESSTEKIQQTIIDGTMSHFLGSKNTQSINDNLNETIVEDNNEDFIQVEDQCATPDTISGKSSVEFCDIDERNCIEEDFEEIKYLDLNKHEIVNKNPEIDNNKEEIIGRPSTFDDSRETVSEGETVSFSDDEIDCEQSIDTQVTGESKYYGKNVIIIFKATIETMKTDEAIEDLVCDYNFEKVNIMATLESESLVNFYEVTCREEITVYIDESITCSSDIQDTENELESKVSQGFSEKDKVLTVDTETENPILDFETQRDTVDPIFSTDATTETEPINEQSLSINDIIYNQSDTYNNGIMINLKIHLPPKTEQNLSKDTSMNIVSEIKTIIDAHLQSSEHNIINDNTIPGLSISTEIGYELETNVTNMIKDEYDHILDGHGFEEPLKETFDNPESEVTDVEVILLPKQEIEDVQKDISENALNASIETGYTSQLGEIEEEEEEQICSEEEEIDDESKIGKDLSIESLNEVIENSDQDTDVTQEETEENTTESEMTDETSPKCIEQEQLREKDELPTITNKLDITDDKTAESEEETNDNDNETEEYDGYKDENIKNCEAVCPEKYDNDAIYDNVAHITENPGVSPEDECSIIQESDTFIGQLSTELINTAETILTVEQVVKEKDISFEISNNVGLENNDLNAESKAGQETIVVPGMSQSQIHEICLENPKLGTNKEIENVVIEYPEDTESKEICPPSSIYNTVLKEFFSNITEDDFLNVFPVNAVCLNPKDRIENLKSEDTKSSTKGLYDTILYDLFSNLSAEDFKKTFPVNDFDFKTPVCNDEEVKIVREDTQSKEICQPTKSLYDAIFRQIYLPVEKTTNQDEVDNIKDTNKLFESKNATEASTSHDLLKLTKNKVEKVSPTKSIYDAILNLFYSNPVLFHERTEELDERFGQSLSSKHNASTEEVLTDQDLLESIESEKRPDCPKNKNADKLNKAVNEYLQDIMHLRPVIEDNYDNQTFNLPENTEANEIKWEKIKSEDSSTSEEETTPTTDRCQQKGINQYEAPIFIFGQNLKEENSDIALIKKRRIDSRTGPWGDTMLSMNHMPLVKNKTIQNIKLPPLNSSNTLPKIKSKTFSKYKRGKFFPTKVKLEKKVKRSYKDKSAIDEEKNVLGKILESEINTSLRMASCSMSAAANLKFLPT